jgi:NTP pyrophosphatase (non-canonical NTP hydrolase)
MEVVLKKRPSVITMEEAVLRANEMFQFVEEIKEERIRQNGKWGWQQWDGYKWLTILAEEFGEIANAILEHDHESIEKELIHTAAVCCAMFEQHKTDKSLS